MVKIAKNKRSSTRMKNNKGKKKKNQSVKQIAENMTEEEIKELMKLRSRQAIEREEQLELETIANNTRKKKFEEKELKKRLVVLGYVFIPTEGQLVDYYLRNKNLCNSMDLCPIEEVDVYANHPQALAEKHPNIAEIWYFFTRSRTNEIQAGIDIQGQWVVCEKKDVFNQEEKVGVQQLLEFCEGDQKSKYKIIEYQLEPAPENLEVTRTFLEKLKIREALMQDLQYKSLDFSLHKHLMQGFPFTQNLVENSNEERSCCAYGERFLSVKFANVLV